MTARFLQLHYLTAYSANNLNRDDLGRPKSLLYGGAPRLRISSQCIKRAWRISDTMQQSLAGNEGVRSRELWLQLAQDFIAQGHKEAEVVAQLSAIRAAFEHAKAKSASEASEEEDSTQDEAPAAKKTAKASKSSKGSKSSKKKALVGLDSLKSDLFFFNQSEINLIRALTKEGLAQGTPHEMTTVHERLAGLPMSGDVAMFGRMVADHGALSVEGAVQVSHPFTVNRAVVDDDFFTAVDELQAEGSGHIGHNGFGSGLYYGYVNIDLPLLVRNLGGDVEQAKALTVALAEAVATVSPGGKQNTFAARSYASFLMAEAGNAQPRSFADAYLRVIREEDLAAVAIDRLRASRDGLFRAFPKQATDLALLDRVSDTGSFQDIETLIDQAFAQ